MPDLKFVSYASNTANYTDGTGADIRVKIFAFGDFNGDGVEDVVVQSSWQGKGGSVDFQGEPLILTRTTADGPLSLIKRLKK